MVSNFCIFFFRMIYEIELMKTSMEISFFIQYIVLRAFNHIYYFQINVFQFKLDPDSLIDPWYITKIFQVTTSCCLLLH